MPPLIDLPLEELRTYQPPLTQPADFEQFWQKTLKEAANVPLAAEVERVDYPVARVRVHRASYAGAGGARIHAWWLTPQDEGRHPTLIVYHGYGGNRDEPWPYLGWVLQGLNVLAIDVRGQDSETPDPAFYPNGANKGWMLRGIEDPAKYYYRNVYVDCVRAIDFACSRDETDPAHIGLMGGSQGGGLTLAAAALDDRPVLAMPEVPYLCNFPRAVELAQTEPYLELVEYFRRYPAQEMRVMQTLAYVDVMNLAPLITCPVLCTVGLQDTTCPPSTVFSAFNHISAASKSMVIFPYHRHELPTSHTTTKLRWTRTYLEV